MIHPKLSLRPQVIDVYTLHQLYTMLSMTGEIYNTRNPQQAYLVHNRGLPSAFVAGVTK